MWPAVRRGAAVRRPRLRIALLTPLVAVTLGACGGSAPAPEPAAVVSAYLDALAERRWEAAQSLTSGDLWLAYAGAGAALERLPATRHETRSLHARLVSGRLAEVDAAGGVRVGARSASAVRKWEGVFRLYRTPAGWRIYRADMRETAG